MNDQSPAEGELIISDEETFEEYSEKNEFAYSFKA